MLQKQNGIVSCICNTQSEHTYCTQHNGIHGERDLFIIKLLCVQHWKFSFILVYNIISIWNISWTSNLYNICLSKMFYTRVICFNVSNIPTVVYSDVGSSVHSLIVCVCVRTYSTCICCTFHSTKYINLFLEIECTFMAWLGRAGLAHMCVCERCIYAWCMYTYGIFLISHLYTHFTFL